MYPKSIRKLKKYPYYVKFNIITSLNTDDLDYFSNRIHYNMYEYPFIEKLPIIYYNKTIYDRVCTINKHLKTTNYATCTLHENEPNALFQLRLYRKNSKNKPLPIYSVFDSKSDYLKWKLKYV